jgi:hypothetical protein
MSSMRIPFAECLLAISAMIVTYLGGEAAFALVGLRYVPLDLQWALPGDVRVFAQSSKTGVVPRDPVFLLGDSYALGTGDWLLETDPNNNGPFHSAHIINELTGRDVVTLGKPGFGSFEALVAFPADAYAEAKHAWYLRLPPPAIEVVYFYEGNDLNDNMRFLARRVENPDAADIVERIDRSINAYPSLVYSGDINWRQHFPLFRFSMTLARHLFASDKSTQRPESNDVVKAAQTDRPNIVEIAGQAVELPANLQSPTMELTRPELKRAALVFERSLVFLRKLLPGTPVLTVYLPSPLSSYRLLSPEVSIRIEKYDIGYGRATRYPKERVAEYSNAICNLIRAAAISQGAGFLDLRPAIRTASTRDLLHGSRDFDHFNRKGMEVLGQTVAERISQPVTQESCANYQ